MNEPREGVRLTNETLRDSTVPTNSSGGDLWCTSVLGEHVYTAIQHGTLTSCNFDTEFEADNEVTFYALECKPEWLDDPNHAGMIQRIDASDTITVYLPSDLKDTYYDELVAAAAIWEYWNDAVFDIVTDESCSGNRCINIEEDPYMTACGFVPHASTTDSTGIRQGASTLQGRRNCRWLAAAQHRAGAGSAR